MVAATAVFWRFKFPQIGIEYLRVELQRNREEIAAADLDRRKLREELHELRVDLVELNERYMDVLQEREILAHDLRLAQRQLRDLRKEG